MTTKRRLWLGFGTLIVVLVSIALAITLWLGKLRGNLQEITSVAGPRSAAAHEMMNYALGAGMGVLKFIETGDPLYRQHVALDAADFTRFKAEYDRLARTPQLQELGERISKLFVDYQALGQTLMDNKYRQQALFTELAQSFDGVVKIIHDKVRAKLDIAGPDGPLKVIRMAYLEADIAGMGTWLGNYQRTSIPAYKAQLFESAKAAQKELDSFRALRLTSWERQLAGEIERLYTQALSQVGDVAALHESQRSDGERFLNLLAQLDGLMDVHLRIVTERELNAAEDAVQKAVNRILVSAFILLGAGIPIALVTSLTVGREILKTEQRIKALLTKERDRGNRLRQLADASITINAANNAESVLGVVQEEARNIIGARQCLVRMETNGQPPIAGGLTAPFSGHGGKIWGVIELQDKLDGEFTFVDEVLLRQLANMAGVSMENARLYKELQQRDQRKDEFLAALGHELRNPLAPIGSALEILRLARGSVSANTAALETIERQFQHLVRIVDDLLNVARITRGKIELRKESVTLAEVIQSVIETSHPLIEAHGHELTVTLPASPIRLRADVTRLVQAIGNLLNNAAKFTPKHGRIALTAEQENGSVAIKVRDTGIGIRAEMLPRVFDPFIQVDTDLERTRDGLGIGLYLVKKLIELHGGTVEAHSAGPGQGSEFIVRLPVEGYEAQIIPPLKTEADMRPVAPLPCRRVLVAEDNRDAAESLGTLLQMMGQEVRIVFDGPSALVEARTYLPDLVLLDIGLPGMHGYEVAQRIREQPELQGVVLVAVTGWGQEEDRRRAREAGFDQHVTKPLSRAALERLLASPGTMEEVPR